jgi:hypothetical protein
MASGKKGGWVYFGESTRSNGSKQIYTGITRRSPHARWGEHMKAVKKNRGDW